MNPEYMKEKFHKTAFPTQRHLNSNFNENHSTKYRWKYKSKMPGSSYLEVPFKSS